MSHVHSIVCSFLGSSFRQSLLTWFSKFNRSKIYNHGQNSWDSYTVRVLFNTRYTNIRALLALYGPIPSPPPHGQCWNRLGNFFWSFNIVLGGKREGLWIFKMIDSTVFFFKYYLWYAQNCCYALTVPRTFVQDCRYLADIFSTLGPHHT